MPHIAKAEQKIGAVLVTTMTTVIAAAMKTDIQLFVVFGSSNLAGH